MINCEFENGHKAKLRHVVVDTILAKDGKILMVKRAKGMTEGGKWTLPGGYMDRDERAVEAAKRELLEESGWEAADMKLFRINDNPNRPAEDRQNVCFIYLGAPGKRTGGSDHEVDEVKWFKLDELPPANQIAFDHADNIELYQDWLKQKFDLPLSS